MFESGLMRVRLGVIFASLIWGSTPALAAAGAPIGLRSLIQAAQSTQVDWLKAESEYLKAKNSVTTERSKLLPDLSISSTYSYEFQNSFRDQTGVGSSAAVLSNWSIWDNGANWRSYKRSTLELEKASIDQIAARDKMTFEILQKYSQYILERRKREIAERKLQLLQVQFRTIERQFRQGLKLVSDYQRLQTEVDRARLNLSGLEDTTQDAFEELKRYVGKKELLPTADQLEIMKAEELLSLFVAKSPGAAHFDAAKVPEVQSANLAVEIERYNRRDLQANLWPNIGLSAKAGYGSDNFAAFHESWKDRDRFFSSATVDLTWTLFNWGGASSAYQSAVLDERMSEFTQRQAILNAEATHLKQTRQADRQEKTIIVLRKIFENERKAYANIESEYRDGRSQFLDLTKSIDSQAQAELELEQNLNSYALVLAQSLQLTGGLYAALFNK